MCTAPAAATTTMTTDAARLALFWLASPALPVGAFSYSETLEAAIDAGDAVDEDGCAAWLLDQLALSLARCDLPVVAAAMAAWHDGDAAAAQALNTWVLASRESAELRRQVEQTGRSLADWVGQRHGDAARAALAALPGGPAWPVAYALAATRAGAPVRDALLAFAFGWAENLVQAAVKAVPLGQSAGQRMLGALAAAIPAAVDEALARAPEDRQAFTPMLAIRSAQHEMQYSRLFRS
jgi:urease accessory protein